MSNIKPPLPEGYASLFAEVKERVRAAQYAAVRAVNKELVDLYWDIGRMIVRRQEGKSWERPPWSDWQPICERTFPALEVSQLSILGE